MARRTCEYRAPALAEPTAERGVRESGLKITRVFHVEDEAVSRCLYETFEC